MVRRYISVERRCGQESSRSLWMVKRIGTPSPLLVVRNNDPYKEIWPTTALLRSLPIFRSIVRSSTRYIFASENLRISISSFSTYANLVTEVSAFLVRAKSHFLARGKAALTVQVYVSRLALTIEQRTFHNLHSKRRDIEIPKKIIRSLVLNF